MLFPLTSSSVTGQQRSRMLATLFKDERCQQLPSYAILEKMYLDRIIRGGQLQEFAARLQPHQKATMSDGRSMLSHSIFLHSICSTFYHIVYSLNHNSLNP